jgi:hypothetical protein
MIEDNGDNRPAIGDTSSKLGVRDSDLRIDNSGNAVPGTGGTSVIEPMPGLRVRLRSMSPSMVPRRLHDDGRIPGAIGSNDRRVFKIGAGVWEVGNLTADLKIVPDSNHHGTIQPQTLMPMTNFRDAIKATRNDWQDGEGDI